MYIYIHIITWCCIYKCIRDRYSIFFCRYSKQLRTNRAGTCQIGNVLPAMMILVVDSELYMTLFLHVVIYMCICALHGFRWFITKKKSMFEQRNALFSLNNPFVNQGFWLGGCLFHEESDYIHFHHLLGIDLDFVGHSTVFTWGHWVLSNRWRFFEPWRILDTKSNHICGHRNLTWTWAMKSPS